MISVNSRTSVADNGGAVQFKCIRVHRTGGSIRKYARLGELISSVSQIRRKYDASMDKKKRMKKVRKKRKIKAKKKREPSLRPYLTLLVNTKKLAKRRTVGGFRNWGPEKIHFDKNVVLTFTDPTKFGPHEKTEGIPNFLGSKVFSPLCREAYCTPKLQKQFKAIFLRLGGGRSRG